MQEVPVEVKKVQVLCKVLRTVSEVQVLGWCNVSSACAVQVFVESASAYVQEVPVLCKVPECKTS